MLKKLKILYLFLIVILICNVSAITSDMKDKYKPGETVLVKISGNILEPITEDQIEFRKAEQINVVVPIFYEIKRFDDNYYLWFITPNDKENMSYTMVIKSISTTNQGQTTRIDFKKNFSLEGKLASYNIIPGFVFTRDDFSVAVNLNEDIDKSITVDFPTNREINLKPGKNTIDFSIKDIKYTTLKNIKIGDYNFLAYISRNSTSQTKKNNTLTINPDSIDSLKLISEKNIKYILTLSNNGGNDLKDLYLTYNKNLFKIDIDKKINLLADESKEIQIQLLENIRNNISEQINIKSDVNNVSETIDVNIRFISNYSIINITKINNTDDNVTLGYYCAELGGKICASSESCSSNEENSLDGRCCLTICQSSKKNTNAWVGYVLILVAILVIGYAYWNYKRVKPNKNLLEKTIDDGKKNDEKNKAKLIP